MKFLQKNAFWLLMLIFCVSCEKIDVGHDNFVPNMEQEEETGLSSILADERLVANNFTIQNDIAYDSYDLTKFDIAIPQSDTPTGLVIYIHGGGFTSGDKSAIREGNNLTNAIHFLNNNIAVASINYRLLENANTETVGVLKPLHDARRALQYIRSRAEDFNIDKDNIVLNGSSAGAGTSLWIATRDDMQDLSNADPVLRESTRVKGIAITATQASYDIEGVWVDDVFGDYGISWNELAQDHLSTIGRFYAVTSAAEYNTPAIDAYRADVDMLSQFSADDPEIFASSTGTVVAPPTDTSIAYHHAFHVREVKKMADAVGIPNVCYYGKNPILYEDPSGETLQEFIVRKINE